MTIDTAANAFMQSIESPILTSFSKAIAYILDPIALGIISIFISLYLYFKVSKKKGIFLISTMIATGILIKVLKYIIGRARPLNALISETSFSLPSGHATAVVVFFGLIVYLFINKKYKISTFLTTALIILLTGFTRIYLRVHWLTDVLAGFFLGGVILTISILIYKKIKLS